MSACMMCRTLEADLEQAHKQARKDMHEINMLRHRAGMAEDALASYKVVHSMALVAEHEGETPVSLLPLVVDAMAILSESQGHKLSFEQMDWGRRRDALMKNLKALVEGE